MLTLVGLVQLVMGGLRIYGEATERGGKVTVPRLLISIVGPIPRCIRPLGLVEGQLKPFALIALGVADHLCHVVSGIGLYLEGNGVSDAATVPVGGRSGAI